MLGRGHHAAAREHQAIHVEGHGYSCTPDRIDQLLFPFYEADRKAGRLDDAYAWARESARQDPDFLGSLNTLGVVYLHRDALAHAARVFGHVLERDAVNLTALANLASAYARQGRIEESLAVQRRLAALEPEPPYHYLHLGLAALKKNHEEAERLVAEQRDKLQKLAGMTQEAARRMRESGVGALAVCEQDRLIGFLTDRGSPVIWRGPIVMNTDAELRQAFEEYRNGTFLKHR